VTLDSPPVRRVAISSTSSTSKHRTVNNVVDLTPVSAFSHPEVEHELNEEGPFHRSQSVIALSSSFSARSPTNDLSKMPPKEDSLKSESEARVDIPEQPTFTLFPKLPTELRIKIWGYACSVTRNVDIWAKPLNIELSHSENLPHYFYSSFPVPAVLHVNTESRSKSLKHYTLDFGTTFEATEEDVPFTISTPPQIYFNWNHDRLCLVDPYRLDDRGDFFLEQGRLNDFLQRCYLKGLRYFAINIGQEPDFPFVYERDELEDDSFLRYIPQKSSLEEIVLFECYHLLSSDACKLNGCELVDLLLGEEDERMKLAKAALAEDITEEQEEMGGTIDQVTPLIRTCKVIYRS
jgi:hypothetical protein